MFPEKNRSACMFPQCFPVLPHGKHCFQGQFCFQEAFRVSARHRSMAKRGNNYGNMFPRFARPLVSYFVFQSHINVQKCCGCEMNHIFASNDYKICSKIFFKKIQLKNILF